MKKEGTGKPQNPDIALDADVRMRELRFEKVPDPEVRFRGNTRRNSVWMNRRHNLPDEVREGVIYRNAGVRLRIATEVVNSDPGFWNSSNKDRVKASLEGSERKTREQEPESREDKEKK
ncbi:MAG: hypothetical protein H0U55_07920 [Rubrobacteraceae bacterium]|nr:hypothetical protein [Rubrobacteraceae bacterium]